MNLFKLVSKRRIINLLYKEVINDRTSHKVSDNDWHNVYDFVNAIKAFFQEYDPNASVNYTDSVKVYEQTDSKSREYRLEAKAMGYTFGLALTCHAAGTMADPWSTYDMTCSVW